MDPPETVLEDKDTSYALIREARKRGFRVDHCAPEDLFLEGGETHARVRPITLADGRTPPIELGAGEDVALGAVDVVFVRKDPPFDDRYLYCTHLLERARGKTLIVNDPRGLRDANEKLYTCHFPHLMPETLVANDKARILAFAVKVGGRAVIKPLDGAGGEGVMVLQVGDPNINAIVEAQTKNGRRLAMVQSFLPEVRKGDKRILLLDGEPLGAILRVPRADDVRSNIHVGGSVEAAALDAEDLRIVAEVRDRLRADGLYFVGLDVIGGRLTEVNVTSPTGIQQMSRFSGQNLSARVVDWAVARAAKAAE